MHRICLEASQYEDNAFVTLTYDDDHLPEGGTLVPRDLQLFLKRLRKSIEPRKVRFFAVGEYGDETFRPHYHLGLFGHPGCRKGVSNFRRDGSCCSVCDGLRAHWSDKRGPLGRVHCGQLSKDAAAYIAGYVTKKMTSADDERLEGRHPEFSRMSTRPGLGAGVMDEVASTMLTYDLEPEDVPDSLQYTRGLHLPLGRYLKQQLRRRIGRSEKTPESIIKKAEANLQPLREYAKATAPRGSREFLFRNLVIDAGEAKRKRKLLKHRARKGHL